LILQNKSQSIGKNRVNKGNYSLKIPILEKNNIKIRNKQKILVLYPVSKNLEEFSENKTIKNKIV